MGEAKIGGMAQHSRPNRCLKRGLKRLGKTHARENTSLASPEIRFIIIASSKFYSPPFFVL